MYVKALAASFGSVNQVITGNRNNGQAAFVSCVRHKVSSYSLV